MPRPHIWTYVHISRDSVVSGAKSSVTGRTYYGVNQGIELAGEKLSGKIAKLLPKIAKKYPLGNCAEVQAVNRALLAGEKLRNLTLYAVKINTGKHMTACWNCTYAFYGKVAAIVSGVTL